MYEAEFFEWSFLQKMSFIWIMGKFTLSKYVAVWILNEAACIISGIR